LDKVVRFYNENRHLYPNHSAVLSTFSSDDFVYNSNKDSNTLAVSTISVDLAPHLGDEKGLQNESPPSLVQPCSNVVQHAGAYGGHYRQLNFLPKSTSRQHDVIDIEVEIHESARLLNTLRSLGLSHRGTDHRQNHQSHQCRQDYFTLTSRELPAMVSGSRNEKPALNIIDSFSATSPGRVTMHADVFKSNNSSMILEAIIPRKCAIADESSLKLKPDLARRKRVKLMNFPVPSIGADVDKASVVYVKPKGVYPTKSNSFRVQLNLKGVLVLRSYSLLHKINYYFIKVLIKNLAVILTLSRKLYGFTKSSYSNPILLQR
jgi:hypothetical protein